MNSTLESKYQMYLITHDYVKVHPPITSKLPGFDGYFTDFTQNNETIKTTKEQLEHGNSGVSKNKTQLRTELVKKTIDVCTKIEVYAKLNDNVILAKEAHYSESELKKARGTTIADKAITVYKKAMEHTTELEKYGVTAVMLSNLKNAIDKYSIVIPSFRIGTSTKKVNNDNLKVLFKTNDAILEKMDLLVEIVKSTNPDFYKGYKNNRKVILKGSGSLAVKAKVICAHDGTEIKGAKATFMRKMEFGITESEAVKPIVKKSAGKGSFTIKNMPNGTYTVTIEKTGYITKTITVNIINGEMVKIEIKLEKI
jgi:hypothetical protein